MSVEIDTLGILFLVTIPLTMLGVSLSNIATALEDLVRATREASKAGDAVASPPQVSDSRPRAAGSNCIALNLRDTP